MFYLRILATLEHVETGRLTEKRGQALNRLTPQAASRFQGMTPTSEKSGLEQNSQTG